MRAKRLANGWSISHCNRTTGINAAQWSRMEAGEPRKKDGSASVPSAKTLHKIAELFDMDLMDLYKEIGIDLADINVREVSTVYEKPEEFSFSEDPDDEIAMAFYTGQPPDVKRDIKLAMLEIVKKHQKGR